METAKTGWEIIPHYWKAIRKFSLEISRYAHTSVGIENKYIYSFGGKDENSSKSIERYTLDNESEILADLNFPRYFSSACSFGDKYIYVYGGYDFISKQLLNKIERINHLNPKVSPSLYEFDQSELPALSGSIIKQFDENTILILGGKAKKFNKNVIYFDCNELTTKCEHLNGKNMNNITNILNYQTDSFIVENEQGNHHNLYIIDWIFNAYSLRTIII